MDRPYRERMSQNFVKTHYNTKCSEVECKGEILLDSDDLLTFLKTEVAERLNDQQANEDLKEHLQGLELTGMGKASLELVLNSQIPEERSWAVGEALAEAYLTKFHGVLFPWNMERDKRNPKGSLPGADIVGFIQTQDGYRFALGEVKSSSELKYPPQVMSGRSGHMGHQIDELAKNCSTICQLLKWLYPRVKGNEFLASFNKACEAYFNSGNSEVSLFGVLIRDTMPNANDLSARGVALGQDLNKPTQCILLALYLPWKLDSLLEKVNIGGTI